MLNKEIIKVFIYVVLWRFYISVIVNISPVFFKLQDNFLGGGKDLYLKTPWFFSMANFDGEHYISIAQNGYRSLQYFFFPVYPGLIRIIFDFFSLSQSFFNYALVGQLISLFSLTLALFFINRILVFEKKEKLFNYVLFLLLFFPTSYYFSAVYTESLFLLLIVLFFYFLYRKNYFLVTFISFIASATRVIGFLMPLIFLFELAVTQKKKFFKLNIMFANFIFLSISSLGLLMYLQFLKNKTGDYLEFINSVSIYGDQRSSEIILLPQVFYRYFYKIIPNISVNYFPIFYVTYLELVTAIIFLLLIVLSFRKVKMKYSLYSLGAFIVPTLSGSFSSLPRYVIIIFPLFILLADYFSRLNKILRLSLFVIFVLLFSISLMLFANGYWIS